MPDWQISSSRIGGEEECTRTQASDCPHHHGATPPLLPVCRLSAGAGVLQLPDRSSLLRGGASRLRLESVYALLLWFRLRLRRLIGMGFLEFLAIVVVLIAGLLLYSE